MVGILRVKYTPYLYDWGRIHISRHFLRKVVLKLEKLIMFSNINDIDKNLEMIKNWFSEILMEIEEKWYDL